ncbi:MAG: hypothetical protein AB7F29_13940 [Candidatus Nitrosocosmicus sp.]
MSKTKNRVIYHQQLSKLFEKEFNKNFKSFMEQLTRFRNFKWEEHDILLLGSMRSLNKDLEFMINYCELYEGFKTVVKQFEELAEVQQ